MCDESLPNRSGSSYYGSSKTCCPRTAPSCFLSSFLTPICGSKSHTLTRLPEVAGWSETSHQLRPQPNRRCSHLQVWTVFCRAGQPTCGRPQSRLSLNHLYSRSLTKDWIYSVLCKLFFQPYVENSMGSWKSSSHPLVLGTSWSL